MSTTPGRLSGNPPKMDGKIDAVINTLSQMLPTIPPPEEIVIPAGLEPLVGIDFVEIHKQHMFLGGIYNPQSHYDVIISDGSRIYHVAETSEPVIKATAKQLPFSVDVISFESQVPFRMEGDPSACCSGVTMTVSFPAIGRLGERNVAQTSGSCCLGTPKFTVTTADNQVVLQIISKRNTCAFSSKREGEFRVMSPNGKNQLGKINKLWHDAGDAGGTSEINFPADMDVLNKAVIILTSIMIDYEYFNRTHYFYRRKM